MPGKRNRPSKNSTNAGYLRRRDTAELFPAERKLRQKRILESMEKHGWVPIRVDSLGRRIVRRVYFPVEAPHGTGESGYDAKDASFFEWRPIGEPRRLF